ncbi:hypothetical protein Pan44_26370 [Caulifigura coniformis]|uniref:Uncharacterized protein n=1 Tax=Caulifigura coniformis TaxID=2527983 RepID=A0A517SEP3_9PLAN|nr:hypothetical protein [Caulifigura coniformis]QDT54603.1 hypothetical protein Pan44_26370 [Caulifigura coniformis]
MHLLKDDPLLLGIVVGAELGEEDSFCPELAPPAKVDRIILRVGRRGCRLEKDEEISAQYVKARILSLRLQDLRGDRSVATAGELQVGAMTARLVLALGFISGATATWAMFAAARDWRLAVALGLGSAVVAGIAEVILTLDSAADLPGQEDSTHVG